MFANPSVSNRRRYVTSRNARASGFTLIEILIVVIILGILAAIVIPQFSSASTQAWHSALQRPCRPCETRSHLYKLQHGDDSAGPDRRQRHNWTLLTGTSTYNGATVGPYMQSIPTNSLSNGFLVANGTSAGGFQAGYDYVYDFNSGAGSATSGARPRTSPEGQSCLNGNSHFEACDGSDWSFEQPCETSIRTVVLPAPKRPIRILPVRWVPCPTQARRDMAPVILREWHEFEGTRHLRDSDRFATMPPTYGHRTHAGIDQ